MSPSLEAWQDESRALASLREIGVVEFVRARGPVEVRAKRTEAEALQEKVNQLLAEAAQIEAILLAAGQEAQLPPHRVAHRPDQCEAVAA